MTVEVFEIETRQKADRLFTRTTPLGISESWTSDVWEVDGYGAINFLAVGDQGFMLVVEEAITKDGPWVQTFSKASSIDPAGSGNSLVCEQVPPCASFMRVSIDNGGAAQEFFNLAGLGLPVSGSAGGGSGPGGTETLDQARQEGDTFEGDVFWDNSFKAVFGKASGEANQDYLRIYSDKGAGVQVIDSEADGAGTVKPISVQIAGTEVLGVDAFGVTVTGKLTVTGAIDPTSVSLSGGTALYFDSATGVTAPVAPAGHGRLRYNDTTKTWQQSVDGGAYVSLATASSGAAWVQGGNAFGALGVIGTTDNFAFSFIANNQEYMRIVDDGPNVNWTGPRLKIGHTGAAFYPNADIISIQKNLGDQLTVTMQNTNNDVLTPAGSTFVLINNDGTKAGGINIMNDNWPAGTDGVNPGDYACIAFGGPAVYGTQTAQDVRFIANEVQWAYYDQSASDFIVDGGNLKVPNGIITARNAGAQILIGDATAPSSAGGAFVFGKNGAQSLTGDETGGESLLVWQGKSGDDALFRVIGGGASGSTHLTYFQLRNADGKNSWWVVPETGVGTNYIQKASFLTVAVDAGYGYRLNVNGTNDSGFSIGTDQTMHQFGTFQSFNIMPEGGDGVGNVGDNTHRWALVRAVTVTQGDCNLEDEKFGSAWTIREAKEEGEDINHLYFINRSNGMNRKFAVNFEKLERLLAAA